MKLEKMKTALKRSKIMLIVKEQIGQTKPMKNIRENNTIGLVSLLWISLNREIIFKNNGKTLKRLLIKKLTHSNRKRMNI